MTTKNMTLSIIIVSWNVRSLLSACLESIAVQLSGLDYRVVVVDNASTDGTVSLLKSIQRKQLRGRLTIAMNTTNRGFATACNQGVAAIDRLHKNIASTDSNHEYILLLNPDTELHGPAIQTLMRFMDKHTRVGVAGPTLFDEQGNIQHSIRRFPSVVSQAMVMLKLQHLVPSFPTYRHYIAADLDYKKEQMVEQIQGACFLVRRKCWDELEGLDEHFFLWFEEVDFCKRAWDNGWEVRYLPTPGVVHHGGTSFAQVMSVNKQRYFHRSILWYMAKHKGFFGWFPIWLMQPIGLLLAYLASFVKPSRTSS